MWNKRRNFQVKLFLTSNRQILFGGFCCKHNQKEKKTMTTKKLLSIFAITLILPHVANAAITYTSTDTPARVAKNGNALRAKDAGPYVAATIENDDLQHIASTAYVKGAYNDAIAGINKLNSYKQSSLYLHTDDNDYSIDSAVVGSLDDIDTDDPESRQYLVNGVAVKNALNAQRVTVYTTWDDDNDNATQQVILSTAQ